jgi:hypothetical protein
MANARSCTDLQGRRGSSRPLQGRGGGANTASGRKRQVACECLAEPSTWANRSTGRGCAAPMQVGGEGERRPHSPWPRHGDAWPRTRRGAAGSALKRRWTGGRNPWLKSRSAHGRVEERHGPASRWACTDELDDEDEPPPALQGADLLRGRSGRMEQRRLDGGTRRRPGRQTAGGAQSR